MGYGSCPTGRHADLTSKTCQFFFAPKDAQSSGIYAKRNSDLFDIFILSCWDLTVFCELDSGAPTSWLVRYNPKESGAWGQTPRWGYR